MEESFEALLARIVKYARGLLAGGDVGVHYVEPGPKSRLYWDKKVLMTFLHRGVMGNEVVHPFSFAASTRK